MPSMQRASQFYAFPAPNTRPIRSSRLRLVQAWIEIHQEELMANWKLAVNGRQVYRIEPLK